MHRALVRVAHARLMQVLTRIAIELRHDLDGPRALLRAATAWGVTRTPVCEFAGRAVDRTRRQIAPASLSQMRALVAVKRRLQRHQACAPLEAATTRRVACRPRAPLSGLTVDGAIVLEASAGLLQTRAVRTAVDVCRRHRARPCLVAAAATRTRARTPVRPSRHLAIDRRRRRCGRRRGRWYGRWCRRRCRLDHAQKDRRVMARGAHVVLAEGLCMRERW